VLEGFQIIHLQSVAIHRVSFEVFSSGLDNIDSLVAIKVKALLVFLRMVAKLINPPHCSMVAYCSIDSEFWELLCDMELEGYWGYLQLIFIINQSSTEKSLKPKRIVLTTPISCDTAHLKRFSEL